MRPFSNVVAVGASAPVRIFSIRISALHAVTIRPNSAGAGMYLGAGGVSSTDGYPLAAGGVLSFSHRDFRDPNTSELFELWALSQSGDSDVGVFGFLSE